MIQGSDITDPIADERRWLHEYVAHGSHDAFACLVDRHINLVYSAAMRQTAGDRHMAEDVTQATLLVLAKRAASIRPGVPLASWLVVVTRYAAKDALKLEARRKRRERAVAIAKTAVIMNPVEDEKTMLTNNGAEGGEWRLIAPELDAALASLRAKDRSAIVLRYLKGHSIEEVAAITGATPNAARQRLHRAVERMREFFHSRGITGVSAAMLGPVLLKYGVQSAPPGLAKGIAAAGISSISSAGISMSGISIAKGVVVAMAWTKTKVVLIAGACLAVLAGGTAVAVNAFHRSTVEQTVVLHPTSSVSGEATSSPVAVQVVGDWHSRFNQIYSLAPGQMVKFIPRPFAPERALYIRESKLPQSANRSLMTFKWNGSLQWQSATYGGENVQIPAEDGAGLAWYDYEDPDKLLQTRMPGDWIIRNGATRPQILAALADLLTAELGAAVQFEKQPTTREVIVVTGNFDLKSLKELPDGEIALGNRPPAPLTAGGPNHDTLKSVFQNLGQQVQLRVIDQSRGSGVSVPWRSFGPTKDGLDGLLKDLGTQTGLQFRRETQKTDVWKVSIDRTWRQRFDAVYGLKADEALKRVAPPFIRERATFWAAEQRRLGGSSDNAALVTHPSITVEYDQSGTPHWTSLSGDRTVRYVLLGAVTGLKPWAIDAGSASDMSLPGDWVTRPGATIEKELADFSAILSSTLAHPVHFERRRVPREVLVARGTYHFTPLQADSAPDVLDLFDAEPLTLGGKMEPQIRQGTLGQVLRSLESRVERPIVDETGASVRPVTWKDHMYNQDPAVLLTNVEKQTGLHFDRETRELDVWLLVGSDGVLYSGPVPAGSAAPN